MCALVSDLATADPSGDSLHDPRARGRQGMPTTMPATEQAIRAVSGWLDEAERLAGMR